MLISFVIRVQALVDKKWRFPFKVKTPGLYNVAGLRGIILLSSYCWPEPSFCCLSERINSTARSASAASRPPPSSSLLQKIRQASYGLTTSGR